MAGYLEGTYAIRYGFIAYSLAVLPPDIRKQAIPSIRRIETWYSDGTLAREQKRYKTQPSITHVDSGARAFIEPSWQWCGYDHAARELGMSTSKLEKQIKAGDACRPDIYLKKAWFVPGSYDHLRGAKVGEFKIHCQWTDPSGGANF